MEPASSRSRSRTPYGQTRLDKEAVEGGNHVEHVVKTTRSTVVKKTYENITTEGGGNTVTSSMSKPAGKTRNTRSSQRARYKTSDYSSEEGDSEVGPSGKDNTRNQLREELLRNANGKSQVSALKIYKEAGEYWNKFPKTDYTYSRHSKDRVELAPGVVVMPNMSRRSLHSYNGSSDSFTAHKQTNTSYEEEYDEEDEEEAASLRTANHISRLRPRTLFTNNNYEENHEYIITRSSSSYKRSVLSRVSSVFIAVFAYAFYPFYYVYAKQHSVFLWFAKKLHKIVSKVMLLDTWLLRGSHSDNKLAMIFALCLLPLMFFGGLHILLASGWWLISGIGQLVYGTIFNSTASVLPAMPLVDVYDSVLFADVPTNPDTAASDINALKTTVVEKSMEMDADEMASHLSAEQLDRIAGIIKKSMNLESSSSSSSFDTDAIVEKVLESPRVQNVIDSKHLDYSNSLQADLLNSHETLVTSLKEEVDKIRLELLRLEKARNEDFSKIVAQLRTENARGNAYVLNEVNKCCRRSFVQIEGHVTRILKDLLGAPAHVNADHQDVSKWLHSVFVAKQELESRLANLTVNLKSDYNALVESGGKRVMDEVAAKLSVELKGRLGKNGEEPIGSVSDEHVKKIVGEALAIYDADKTGLVDYALELSGGQVVSTRCTESYQSRTAVISVLGVPLWYPTNTPRTVITPGVNPGECWAFQNFPGFLVLKLSARVRVEAFTMEHISKLLIPNGRIESAPRDFEVYGLRDDTDREPALLGRYAYNFDGRPLQYFPAQTRGLAYDHVELRILSNHGNPNYTCLYRFRVHGVSGVEPT